MHSCSDVWNRKKIHIYVCVCVSLSNRWSICLKLLSNAFFTQIYCFGVMLLVHTSSEFQFRGSYMLSWWYSGISILKFMFQHSVNHICYAYVNMNFQCKWAAGPWKLKKWLKNKRIFSTRVLFFSLQVQSHSHSKTHNPRIFVLRAWISPNVLNGSENFHKVHQYHTSGMVENFIIFFWANPVPITSVSFIIRGMDWWEE